MKKIIRKILAKLFKGSLFFEVYVFIKNAKKRTCLACGNKSYFRSFNGRENVKCIFCAGLERHRLFMHIYKERLKKGSKVLHFAPETPLYKFFTENFDYTGADLFPDRYLLSKKVEKQDATNISYEDGTFDYVIINHVLEHIPNDLDAMKDIRRVLKDTGEMYMSVPYYELEKTFEDSSYNTDIERAIMFDQHDHVRKYGKDLSERLKSAGFSNIERIEAKDIFSAKEIDNYGLSTDIIWICKK